MTLRKFLASVAIGVIALATGGPAGAQTPAYRTFQPDGPGPHPVVVFAPGCSGFAPSIAPNSYEQAAERLWSQGYVVLFAERFLKAGESERR